MAFAIKPEELDEVLLLGLTDIDRDLTEYGYGKGSLRDWIDDICSAYRELWAKYGPFTAKGVSENRLDVIQADPWWQEFSVKMRALYSLVYDSQSSKVAYPWVTYLFTGMTEDEIYELGKACYAKYKDVDTSVVRWTSPESIRSKTGVVSYEWTSGVQVSENIKELWRALEEMKTANALCAAAEHH